jgi:hypothetical protein
MRLDLLAGGSQRFFEVPPDILHRMEMVSLKSGLRLDRFDGFSEALRVIGEGCRDVQSEVFSLLKKFPGIRTMLRRRFIGHQDAIMLILHHHHTVVRTQRVVAVNRTLRCWGEGQQLLKHLLWRGQVRANVINPAFH